MARLRIPGTWSRFISTYRYMRDPYGSFEKWHKKFGDTFLIRALNGDVIATSNLENVRRIFAAKHDSVGQFAIDTTRALVGGQSVFLAEGERHRLERALLLPSFHGELIRETEETIRSVVMKATHNWQPGDNIRIMDVALDISLEVILQIVFGIQNNDAIIAYRQTITRFVKSFHPVLAFTRLFQRPLFGLSPWNGFVRARDEFDELIKIEIKARREVDERNNRSDLLSRLLVARYEDGTQINDEGIRDQLVTLLLAGHETTQIAISWAMSWVVRNPKHLQRLLAELAENDIERSFTNPSYGGGIRRCIGATLAVLEIKIVVATLLKNFRFELPQDAPETETVHRRNLTLAPKSGIPLVFTGKRQDAGEAKEKIKARCASE